MVALHPVFPLTLFLPNTRYPIPSIMSNLLSAIITSKTRNHLFLRLFLNTEARAYLRELAMELGSSSNAVREELNRLVEAKLLNSGANGKKVLYGANKSHPLFPEIQSMVRKVLGIEHLMENVILSLGNLDMAILLDDYACGKDSGIIDLVLVGDINENRLNELVKNTERYIKRKIRTFTLTGPEYAKFADNFNSRPNLILWQRKT